MDIADKNLPIGQTEAARREREQFEVRRRAFVLETRKIALSILVWGPNPNSQIAPLVAKKRTEIRDKLLELGHNAMFSEEISVLPEESYLSEKDRELAQARAAHLIVILVEGAPGAQAEAHDFCDDPELRPKIYVMFPLKYKEGYSARGAIRDLDEGYGGVFWYEERDLEQCNVLTRAIRRAEVRRNDEYCRRRGSHEQP
jgi:hypothetical protein